MSAQIKSLPTGGPVGRLERFIKRELRLRLARGGLGNRLARSRVEVDGQLVRFTRLQRDRLLADLLLAIAPMVARMA